MQFFIPASNEPTPGTMIFVAPSRSCADAAILDLAPKFSMFCIDPRLLVPQSTIELVPGAPGLVPEAPPFVSSVAALAMFAIPVVIVFGIAGVVMGIRRLLRRPR